MQTESKMVDEVLKFMHSDRADHIMVGVLIKTAIVMITVGFWWVIYLLLSKKFGGV